MGNNIKENITKWADEQAEKLEQLVIDKINDPEVRTKVINKWNDSVNIPILNEKTEERIFSAIYDTVVDVLEGVIKK